MNQFIITNNTLLKHLITRTTFDTLYDYDIKEGEIVYETLDKRIYYGDDLNNKISGNDYYVNLMYNPLSTDLCISLAENKIKSNIYDVQYYANTDYPVYNNGKLTIVPYIDNALNNLYGGICYNNGTINISGNNAISLSAWSICYDINYIINTKTLLSRFGNYNIILDNNNLLLYINDYPISIAETIQNCKLIIIYNDKNVVIYKGIVGSDEIQIGSAILPDVLTNNIENELFLIAEMYNTSVYDIALPLSTVQNYINDIKTYQNLIVDINNIKISDIQSGIISGNIDNLYPNQKKSNNNNIFKNTNNLSLNRLNTGLSYVSDGSIINYPIDISESQPYFEIKSENYWFTNYITDEYLNSNIRDTWGKIYLYCPSIQHNLILFNSIKYNDINDFIPLSSISNIIFEPSNNNINIKQGCIRYGDGNSWTKWEAINFDSYLTPMCLNYENAKFSPHR